jgi:hypothetical protein
MGALVDFFADLDANAAAKAKLQGIGAAQFASLKLQAADADMARGFVVANPVGTAHLTAADGVGVVHSYYTDGGLIVMPSALRKTSNGEVWVASETASAAIALARFDANFSFLGYWGRSAAADGLYLTRDFALDEVNRRIYTVGNNHVLRAFDLDTQAMLWQFGTHNAALNLPTGLYTPSGVDMLPNGNIIVASWSGMAVGASGHGHLSEFDPAGALVATHAMNNGGVSEPWSGSIRNPDKVRVDALNNLIYVSLYYDDMIAVYDATSFAYVACYTKPAGIAAGNLLPRGFYVSQDHNQLVIGASSPRLLAALGVDNHDLAWIAGHAVYDAGAQAFNRPNELWGCRDVLELSPGHYLVADDGNNRLTVISNNNTHIIPYDTAALIPAGWQLALAAMPTGYDPTNHTMTVPLANAATAGALYLPIERSHAYV